MTDPRPQCPVTHLTTDFGVPGAQQPRQPDGRQPWYWLAQDVWLNVLANFVREVIPERRMYARARARLAPLPTKDITRYTAQGYLREGRQADRDVRPLHHRGRRYGAADAERDIRGFAPEVLHRGGQLGHGGQQHAGVLHPRPAPVPRPEQGRQARSETNMRSATNNWDYWTLLPEALHQITIVVMSERGIPASYRPCTAWPRTPTASGTRRRALWVKFHFKTQQGIKNLTDAEAEALIGSGPRKPPARPVRRHCPRRLPQVDDVRAGHARGMPTRYPTTRST